MKRSLITAAITSVLFAFPLSAEDSGKMYQATANSNIRAAPTTNSQKIGYLKQGNQRPGDRKRRWRQLAPGSLEQRADGLRLWSPARVDRGSGSLEPSTPSLKGGPTEAPEDAFAYIIWPQDGEVIPGGDFVVLFGLHGMGTAPAGVDKAHTGPSSPADRYGPTATGSADPCE